MIRGSGRIGSREIWRRNCGSGSIGLHRWVKKKRLIGDCAAIRDTYLCVHQSTKESRNRLQGAQRDLDRRKRKDQRDHPREFAERGNENLGTAQPRARILVEGACYLVFGRRDQSHPPNLQD